MTRELQPVARWAQVTTLILSVLGLAVSIYLTKEHFSSSAFAGCPENSLFNCQAVTTSAQSYFLGIPVAVLGLVSYVFMTAINTPWAWRATNYWLHVVRFVFSLGSMAFVLWLITAEIVIIGHLCLYCTGVHIITFILMIVLTRVSPTQLGWTRSATE
jgi:uncharacterized membrane protein